jgi:hypothetical protein
MLWSLCGSSPFLIWTEVARSCVSAEGTRIQYQEHAFNTKVDIGQCQRHLVRHLRRQLGCALRPRLSASDTRLSIKRGLNPDLLEIAPARIERFAVDFAQDAPSSSACILFNKHKHRAPRGSAGIEKHPRGHAESSKTRAFCSNGVCA